MRGINASYIDQEYKREQAYKRIKRNKCKGKPCMECKYKEICEDKEVDVKHECNNLS